MIVTCHVTNCAVTRHTQYVTAVVPTPAASSEMKMKQTTTRPVTPSELGVATEGYLDKKAVARLLGVVPRTVNDWVKEGKIPGYRIGNRFRFKWAEVEQHLAAKCRLGKAER